MKLRRYQLEDLMDVVRLFHDTVHTSNRADYSEEQVEAWAPATPDLEHWRKKLADEDAVVAELEGKIVGFCSWDQEGYLDFLYVHPAHQRKGIATALFGAAQEALQARALSRVQTRSSTTAHPFFTRQGFQLVDRRTVSLNGVAMPSLIMEKKIPPPTRPTDLT